LGVRGLLQVSLFFSVGWTSLSVALIQTDLRLELPSGLHCQAYAWTSPALLALTSQAQRQVPRILFAHGTGIYTVANEGYSALNPLVEQGKAILLGFDKPGIESKGSEVGYSDEYPRHRQSDLLDCAEATLHWSEGDQKWSGPLILVGHSEGAEVLIRFADRRLQTKSLPKILGMFFSGTPLEPWKTRIAASLARQEPAMKEAFRGAWEKGDEAFFLSPRVGSIPLPYLRAEASSVGLGESLHHLVEALPHTPFQLFHGEKDTRCRVEAVWKMKTSFASFDHFSVTTYPGVGHSLGAAFTEAIFQTIDELVSTP